MRLPLSIALLAAAALLCVACGGEEAPLGDCPSGAQQQASSGAFILFGTCAGCHSSQLEGADRQGAPPGMDFDDTDIIRDMAEDIYRTAVEGTMPPPSSDVPMLNAEQVEALRVYLACQE